jgi:short-subunit dehydrogenase
MHMLAARKGGIVNIASMSGLAASFSLEHRVFVG